MKNAIETEKTAMTPDEKAFIDRFVADYCRPHETVVAARLAAFSRMASVPAASPSPPA